MKASDRRHQDRVEVHLLACYHVKEGAQTATGFARTMNLSHVGVMIESPDPMDSGQELALEFLLDNNRVLKLGGRVTHVSPGEKGMQWVGVAFENLTAADKKLLAEQLAE